MKGSASPPPGLAVKPAQRERRITSALFRTGPVPSADVWTQVAQHSDVFAAIGRLTPKERVVVVLFYFEDRSTAEIAQLLGCWGERGQDQVAPGARTHG